MVVNRKEYSTIGGDHVFVTQKKILMLPHVTAKWGSMCRKCRFNPRQRNDQDKCRQSYKVPTGLGFLYHGQL